MAGYDARTILSMSSSSCRMCLHVGLSRFQLATGSIAHCGSDFVFHVWWMIRGIGELSREAASAGPRLDARRLRRRAEAGAVSEAWWETWNDQRASSQRTATNSPAAPSRLRSSIQASRQRTERGGQPPLTALLPLPRSYTPVSSASAAAALDRVRDD